MSKRKQSVPVFIGIDGGGTSTRLVAARGEEHVADLSGPASNVQQVGHAEVASRLVDLIDQAIHSLPDGYTVGGVHAGLAGAGQMVDAERVRENMLSLIASSSRGPILGGTPIVVGDDGEIALQAALQDQSGIVVIAGTGSNVLARTKLGARLSIGGWGSLLGDEGSGYALGLYALRQVAAAFDHETSTGLRAAAREYLGVHTRADLLRIVYRERLSPARFAPSVTRLAAEHDTEALSVLQRAVSELVGSVLELAVRTDIVIAPRLFLAGGMASSNIYVETFSRTLHDSLPEWSFGVSAVPPVQGALDLARRLAPTG